MSDEQKKEHSTKPSTTQENSSQPSRVPPTGKTTKKMSRKKIVSRNAAIALVLVLVLLASLVSVIAIYVPMVSDLNSQITEKEDTIVSLSSQISAIQSALNQLASNLTAKDNQIEALNEQLNSIAAEYNSVLADYNAIIALGKSGYLLSDYPVTNQTANSSTVIWKEVIRYAGYVTVNLQSTSNTTYARLIYASYGVNFDQNITLGESGTAAFPVLPGEIIFSVGNTELVDSVNANVTALYVY